MTSITFGPAEARAKKIIAGLAGGTGSGKTYSALEIGTGLVADPARHLFVIDTEFGRAAHYASTFKFQYGQLSSPFTPRRYKEAIEVAVGAGAHCVIVDSLSHMWEGEGGAREQAFEIAQRMSARSGGHPEKYSYMSWNEPKEAITKFILFLQRCDAHLVLCLRAKEKSKMVSREGKSEIINVGLQPIMEDGMPYECTFLAMLDQEQPGVPHWTHKALASYLQPLFENGGKQLSREHGRRLAVWCGTESPGSHATYESHRAADPGGPKTAGVAQQEEQPPCERTVVGSTPAAGTTTPQPSGEHAQPREPAATTAAGPVDWKTRGAAITAAFKAAVTMPELNRLEAHHRAEIATFPPAAQSRVASVFHEKRETLMAPLDDTEAVVADLEGRIEDERQEELLPR